MFAVKSIVSLYTGTIALMLRCEARRAEPRSTHRRQGASFEAPPAQGRGRTSG